MEPTVETIEVQDLSSTMTSLAKGNVTSIEARTTIRQGITLAKQMPATSLDKARLLMAIQKLGMRAGFFSFHRTVLTRTRSSY
jgi:hypothetical protein